MKTIGLNEYRECETCAAKPGSPELCRGCYQNRTAISQRDDLIDTLYKKIEAVSLIIDL